MDHNHKWQYDKHYSTKHIKECRNLNHIYALISYFHQWGFDLLETPPGHFN